MHNRNTFKIKAGYYLKLLIPETMKLLWKHWKQADKDENGEKVSHLQITEVILARCNVANNDYQQNLEVLYTFVPNR